MNHSRVSSYDLGCLLFTGACSSASVEKEERGTAIDVIAGATVALREMLPILVATQIDTTRCTLGCRGVSRSSASLQYNASVVPLQHRMSPRCVHALLRIHPCANIAAERSMIKVDGVDGPDDKWRLFEMET